MRSKASSLSASAEYHRNNKAIQRRYWHFTNVADMQTVEGSKQRTQILARFFIVRIFLLFTTFMCGVSLPVLDIQVYACKHSVELLYYCGAALLSSSFSTCSPAAATMMRKFYRRSRRLVSTLLSLGRCKMKPTCYHIFQRCRRLSVVQKTMWQCSLAAALQPLSYLDTSVLTNALGSRAENMHRHFNTVCAVWHY